MARKKSQTAETASEQTSGTTTAENGQDRTGKSKKQGGKRGQKTDAVREALGKGIESPKAIAEYVYEHHGLKMTAAHASTIKGTLRRGKSTKGARQKQAPAARKEQAAAPAKVSTRNGGGLTPGDLVELADLAERAGGADRLQEYLQVLQQIR